METSRTPKDRERAGSGTPNGPIRLGRARFTVCLVAWIFAYGWFQMTADPTIRSVRRNPDYHLVGMLLGVPLWAVCAIRLADTGVRRWLAALLPIVVWLAHPLWLHTRFLFERLGFEIRHSLGVVWMIPSGALLVFACVVPSNRIGKSGSDEPGY